MPLVDAGACWHAAVQFARGACMRSPSAVQSGARLGDGLRCMLACSGLWQCAGQPLAAHCGSGLLEASVAHLLCRGPHPLAPEPVLGKLQGREGQRRGSQATQHMKPARRCPAMPSRHECSALDPHCTVLRVPTTPTLADWPTLTWMRSTGTPCKQVCTTVTPCTPPCTQMATDLDVDALHRHPLGLWQEEDDEQGHQPHPAGAASGKRV